MEALEIALRSNIAVYGALFIAIARRENPELATCDEKREKTARKEGLRAMLLS